MPWQLMGTCSQAVLHSWSRLLPCPSKLLHEGSIEDSILTQPAPPSGGSPPLLPQLLTATSLRHPPDAPTPALQDTVFDSLASHPQQLFLTDHYEDRVPLVVVQRKCTVARQPASVSAGAGAEPPGKQQQPQSGGHCLSGGGDREGGGSGWAGSAEGEGAAYFCLFHCDHTSMKLSPLELEVC